MKVLISGVTGYIGRALTKRLHDAGHRVVGLSRDPGSARRDMPLLDEVFGWAPLTQEPPLEAFDNVDGVVHLVGESVAGRWTTRKKQAIAESRILSTRNLVGAIGQLQAKPLVLVSGSAVGWYGHRGDDELTEDEPAGADFLGGVCRQWETEATAAEGFGVRVVRLRTGLVLGPGSPFLKPQLPIHRLGFGGSVGSGRQWWPWVHIDDLTVLLAYALEYPISGPVNATAPEPVRQREFARTLGRVVHRPAFLPVPSLLVKLAFGEFSDELLSSKRVLSAKAQAAGYTFTYQSLEMALRDVVSRWKEGLG
jgi:uncharacterized protein (TIGR01777 family)